ncbi:MAG: Malonate decarboxylase acyl carrier protein [Proteobacteria bacterium]|nr:Malonate decarboxylase acyl carrier protein [Pseudomonadota bacterium]
MALTQLKYEFSPATPRALPVPAVHFGVVGSGDMEVIIENKDLGGKAVATVVTPVTGFDHVWEMVLRRFMDECQLGNVAISINDNNATPVVVSLRLRQALLEIEG